MYKQVCFARLQQSKLQNNCSGPLVIAILTQASLLCPTTAVKITKQLLGAADNCYYNTSKFALPDYSSQNYKTTARGRW
jgi:hypothetical protein